MGRGEMMLNSFVEDIVGRYVLIVRKLVEMVGVNLIVGDFICNVICNCLVGMYVVGVELFEIC